ncbi:hypothetical protein RYX36_031350 [Vicia faba]
MGGLVDFIAIEKMSLPHLPQTNYGFMGFQNSEEGSGKTLFLHVQGFETARFFFASFWNTTYYVSEESGTEKIGEGSDKKNKSNSGLIFGDISFDGSWFEL